MNPLTLQTWFPVTIGSIECPFIDDIKDKYKKILSKFKYDDNGLCYEQIHKNKKFDKLNKWITDNINKYAKAHCFKHTYEPKESWVLDYPIGKGQPFHSHYGYTISCVFYLEANENDQPTIFANPFLDMKNPTGMNLQNYNDIKLNELSYAQCEYSCRSGRLVIFRSHISHAVDPKQIKDKRIVFSYNFDPEVSNG
tara:strand:- start:1870 stop:2457 length:588 start_codon:yes stop_codon:yes gene_type:complete